MTGKRKEDRFSFTRDYLYQAYIVDRKTPTMIAKETGYSLSAVGDYLLKQGFRDMHRKAEEFPLSDDELRRLYVDERQSIRRIGRKIGWHEGSIHDRLRLLGIPLRSRGGKDPAPSRDWLTEQFWLRNRTLADIAVELKMGTAALRRLLVKMDVPKKPRSISAKSRSPVGTPKNRYPRKYTVFTEWQRLSIIKRDGGICRMPGCGSMESLECHHIIPRRYNGPSTIGNGITLCDVCHWKIHKRELEYVNQLKAARGH